MRSTTFSSLAVLASSLLVKEVLAGRYDVRKRAIVTEEVIVSDEVIVTKELDGSYRTGAAIPFTTITIDGSAVVYSAPVKTAPAKSAPEKSAPAKTASAKAVDPVSNTPLTPPSSVAAPEHTSVAAVSQHPSSVVAPVHSSSEAPKKSGAGDEGSNFGPTSKESVHAPTTLATVKTPPKTSVAAPKPTVKPSVAAPKPTVKSSPAAPKSTPSSGSGKKRGIAYNDQSLLSDFTSSGKFGWAYNWGAGPATSPAIPSGLEFVPMLWGTKADQTGAWNAAAEKALSSGSTHLMSFNEPDLGAQANISPAVAAAAYKQFMQPLAKSAKLGSPAVTNGNSQSPPVGLPWLTAFLNDCSGCTIDFVSIHWYAGGDLNSAVANFEQHVKDAYAAGKNRPIWITEFQYLGNDQAGFLEKVIPWLDSQDMVQRYAYFMAQNGILTSGSALSALGKTYVSA